MNPPIPSLYSVGGEFSQEANNCPLFVLPPAQSLHLLFLILSILAPSIYFSSKQLNPIQETFRINCFFFLHQSWFVCVPHVQLSFCQIHSFVCPPTDLSCQHFICFPWHTNIYIFLVWTSVTDSEDKIWRGYHTHVCPSTKILANLICQVCPPTIFNLFKKFPKTR